VSCHLIDFNKTTNPNHAAAGFPQDCSVCHTTTNWLGAKFDHNAATKFPLTGAHVSVACSQCHINNKFAGTPANCASCHIKDYNGATFDHSKTGFALTGTHTTTACAACHVGGNYNLTSALCYNCHQKEYQGTTNPAHAAAGFPTDCSVCHTTTNWLGAKFDHSKTGFALTGTHTTTACAACHVGGNYNLTSALCYNCHQKEYQGTTNPAHAAAGFPQDCSTCHTTTNWLGATFDHSKTGFALTGTHTTTACSACHVGGNYNLNSAACYNCHQKEYQSTTNPNHSAAGFPTTCDTCHSTTNWLGATFNHTWFKLPHSNALCSDCHTNSSNYTVFVCTNCHTKAQTDPKHQGIKGYVWNSANCYSCHKNGGN
jgi:hypothetical protein